MGTDGTGRLEKRVCTVVVDFAVPASQGRVYREICMVCRCRPSAVPGRPKRAGRGGGEEPHAKAAKVATGGYMR